jgi:hypothetical protein
MHKRTITYEDFNGVMQTEIAYFNMTKAELVELQFSIDGGFKEWIEEIGRAEKNSEIIPVFKRVISNAYGKKSADGKTFVKLTQNEADAFYQTAAYAALFMELIVDADKLGEFMNDIVPANLAAEAESIANAEAARQGKTPSQIARERSEAQMQGRQQSQNPVHTVTDAPVELATASATTFPEEEIQIREVPQNEEYQRFLEWQKSQTQQ